MTSIMKTTELARTGDQQSFEGWVTVSAGARTATRSSTNEFDFHVMSPETAETYQLESVAAHEQDAFMASIDGMLLPMQGCIPFVWC
jgi:hypothetical protein